MCHFALHLWQRKLSTGVKELVIARVSGQAPECWGGPQHTSRR